MTFTCPRCGVHNDLSDLPELHDGVRLICLACDGVTVVHLEAHVPTKVVPC